MIFHFPHTITNPIGETLIFKELVKESDGDMLRVENYVTPKSGPPMHTHLLQDEALTVVKGRTGYQLQSGPQQFAGVGETVVFHRGISHRLGMPERTLHCKGYVKLPTLLFFYLLSIYAAQNKSGTVRPEKWDADYLLKRHATDYDIAEIPFFVKKVIVLATYYIGRLLGKNNQFKNAPESIPK